MKIREKQNKNGNIVEIAVHINKIHKFIRNICIIANA
jgi:hypothetical protein